MPVHHRAHLRHLPGEPPAGLVQGLRRHHGRALPRRRRKLRELVHCAQFVQSHALSFFHLSAPDLLLGFDSDPAARNVFGLIEEHPEMAKRGVALRKFGQQVIEGLAKERVHPSWIVPGGVNAPLSRRGARPHPGRIARRARPGRQDHRVLQDRARPVQGRDRQLRHGAHDVRGLGGRRTAACNGTTAHLKFKDAEGATVPEADARARLRHLHRRSVAARFLPESALLQAARLPRRASTAWDRWRA